MKKRPAPVRQVVVRPNGDLSGHEFIMRGLSAKVFLAIRGGTATDEMMLEATLEAIIDSTLDCDPGELEPVQLAGLTRAWQEVWQDAALPPTSGRPSRRRSPSPRSIPTPTPSSP